MFRAVEDSAALLVIMGRNWLDAKDDHGQRRIDDPGDFVHREIATALRLGKQTIPVLLGIQRIPPEDLPAELRELAKRQDIKVGFRSAQIDIDRLVAKLRQQIPTLRNAGAAKSEFPVGKFSVHAGQIDKVWQAEQMTFEGDFYAGSP